tara:strand:- start:1333 stop:1440 length:108 start_codon:yes stop_codon:yes gene_type:complete
MDRFNIENALVGVSGIVRIFTVQLMFPVQFFFGVP